MNVNRRNQGRREFLEAVTLTGLAAAIPRAWQPSRQVTINDVTRLNPVPVARELRPASVDEVKKVVKTWPGSLSVGSGRLNMGGQITAVCCVQTEGRSAQPATQFVVGSLPGRSLKAKQVQCWPYSG
jgi:hypothetical protein